MISSVATTIGGSRRLNYTYNDDEQVISKSMTLTTPYVNTYTYNDEGLIATDTVTAKNGTFAYGYTYDDMANITSITKNGTVQQNYAYDENSQLVREDNRDINKSIVYSYDGYGNILNKKEYAFTTGDLGTVTDTITYSYDSVWKDKLTSYDGQSITYDSMGNPLSYRGATLDWNGRRLMSYNKDGTSISYEYDSNGMRTSKTVNGVRQEYYYDENGQLLYEIKQGVYELYYKYDADGNLFSITRYRYSDGARHVFYAITNSRGDVIELRENSGAVYATYTYDSWGRCVSVKNSSGNACSVNTVAVQSSIRYRGYVYDYETGLYYLQSRYYDAETGRFLNADAVDYIGYSGENLSYNAFAYCENEPVNGEDPSGNYDRKAVYKYAKKYTLGLDIPWLFCSNIDYYYYPGGDCANFVSQCLHAGGIKMTRGWFGYYYISGKGRTWTNTFSWTKVENQRKYFLNWKYINRVIYISFSDVTQTKFLKGSENRIDSFIKFLQCGDLLFMDSKFDKKEIYTHSTIITKVGKKDIYYSAHTSNRFNHSLKKRLKKGTIERICILVMKDSAT